MGVGTDSAIARPAFPCRAYGRTVLSEKIIRGNYAEFLWSRAGHLTSAAVVTKWWRVTAHQIIPATSGRTCLRKRIQVLLFEQDEMGWEVDGDSRAL